MKCAPHFLKVFAFTLSNSVRTDMNAGANSQSLERRSTNTKSSASPVLFWVFFFLFYCARFWTVLVSISFCPCGHKHANLQQSEKLSVAAKRSLSYTQILRKVSAIPLIDQGQEEFSAVSFELLPLPAILQSAETHTAIGWGRSPKAIWEESPQTDC